MRGKTKKYKCIECGKEFKLQPGGLKRRKVKSGVPICKECYKKNHSKGGRYGLKKDVPESLQGKWNNEYWEYKDILPYLDILKTKKLIKFTCQECDEEDLMEFNKMRRRSICGVKPICSKCALKYATSSDEWKENNSKAQLIAQNREDVIKKQRKAHERLVKEDPLYFEKRNSKQFVSGSIRGIHFHSSWELLYIIYCFKNSKILEIKRSDKKIPYKDKANKTRNYYPDFEIKTKNNSYLVEIKGNKVFHNYNEKLNAAKKIFGEKYIVFSLKELKNRGILVRSDVYVRRQVTPYLKDIRFIDNKAVQNFFIRLKTKKQKNENKKNIKKRI